MLVDDTDQLRCTRLPIAQIYADVMGAGCQRRCLRPEGYKTAVGTDYRTCTWPVALSSCGANAHPFGGSHCPVPHENVVSPIGVPGNEVGCEGLKGDIAAARADARTYAVEITSTSAGRDAHQGSRPGLQVP